MQQDDKTGILLALAGFALLSVGDTIIKTMAGQWSPIAVAGLRFTFGALGLSTLLLLREGPRAFRPRNPWLQLARGFCLAMATLGFFSAIFIMPLAEATSLIFIAPVLVALLSGPLLKEKVLPSTWVASLIAFAGVLIVLRPNLLELGITALLPLGSATFMALLVIANRASSGQGSPLSMQALMALSAAPILVAAAFLGRWTGMEALAFSWPDATVVLRCALVAITASTAHWLVYLGTTRAGAATIAPMTYVQLLVVSITGFLLFDDIPDLATVIGASIIIGAGLFLWSRGAKPKSARHD